MDDTYIIKKENGVGSRYWTCNSKVM